jgi:hypothetical protein
MIDWMSAKHQITEFHRLHGGECYDEGSGHLIYPDGAVRSVEGALWTPPLADPNTERGKYEIASRRLKFFQAKLGAAVRPFDALREELEYQQPNDEKAALAKLEALAAVVKARQEEVRKAQEIVDNTSIGKAIKAGKTQPQQQVVRTSVWRAKLKAIRV